MCDRGKRDKQSFQCLFKTCYSTVCVNNPMYIHHKVYICTWKTLSFILCNKWSFSMVSVFRMYKQCLLSKRSTTISLHKKPYLTTSGKQAVKKDIIYLGRNLGDSFIPQWKNDFFLQRHHLNGIGEISVNDKGRKWTTKLVFESSPQFPVSTGRERTDGMKLDSLWSPEFRPAHRLSHFVRSTT